MYQHGQLSILEALFFNIYHIVISISYVSILLHLWPVPLFHFYYVIAIIYVGNRNSSKLQVVFCRIVILFSSFYISSSRYYFKFIAFFHVFSESSEAVAHKKLTIQSGINQCFSTLSWRTQLKCFSLNFHSCTVAYLK